MWWWEGWKGCAFERRGAGVVRFGISFLLMEVDRGGRGQKKNWGVNFFFNEIKVKFSILYFNINQNFQFFGNFPILIYTIQILTEGSSTFTICLHVTRFTNKDNLHNIWAPNIENLKVGEMGGQ
jgi:hypothetical protein